MTQSKTKSGIGVLDDVPWGTHLCQFYQTKEDLVEILVPYFKAGLENNEFCTWVTSEPLRSEEAKAVLKKTVKDLDSYLEKGQIEFLDYSEWYTKSGKFDANEVLQGWAEKEKIALEKGFAGLRASGNTFWLEPKDWKSFKYYDEALDSFISKHRIIAICAYSLAKCGPQEILDAVSNHRFALARSDGHWDLVKGVMRRRASERIRNMYEFTLQIIQSFKEGVATVDGDGNLVQVNAALCKITGFNEEELLGQKPPFNFWAEEGLEDIAKAFEDTLQGIEGEYESIFKKKDGTRFIALVSPKKILDPDGSPFFFATVKDITRQKKNEDQLQFLSSITEQVTDGVVVTDTDYRIIYVNKAMQTLWGYSAVELQGLKPYKFTVEPMSEQILADISKTLASGEVSKWTVLSRRKDGTPFLCEFKVSAMYNKNHQVSGYVGIQRDVTEHKQLEEEQEKAAKLESVGTLAGGIAHDFNNLLTGIMGNIGLAKICMDSKGEAFERLQESEKACMRARDLTQQLLIFARGGQPVKKLSSIAEIVKDSAVFALSGSKASPEFSLPDDLWAAEVDAGQISQVINNIVINADAAMPNGGKISISASNSVIKGAKAIPLPRGNYVNIIIQDNGIGISKKYLSKIFDPYFTTKQKGSGLGLTTSYSIIKNHGGYITVESEVSVGTTVRIYIPASRKPVTMKKEEEAFQAAFQGRGRILVMDDEDMIRLLVSQILTGAGYQVELTKDGEEAIKQYTAARESGHPFDAVIMDLTIPGGMGGKEAIRKLLEIDPNVRVIVSSGYATDPLMSEYKRYGFSAVVSKPYKVRDLRNTVASLLEGIK